MRIFLHHKSELMKKLDESDKESCDPAIKLRDVVLELGFLETVYKRFPELHNKPALQHSPKPL